MSTETALEHGIAPEVYRRRWWILSVLCLSLLIVFIGNSSLNVAIPTLARELDATESQLQWVVASYSLVFAGLLLTSGAIGDRFGRKTALQFGLLVFLLSALAHRPRRRPGSSSPARPLWEPGRLPAGDAAVR